MRFLLPLILLLSPLLAAAQLRFGIVSPHDAESSVQWEALEAYFSKALGIPVTIVRHPPNRVGRELMAGTLSFALVNPVTAVEVIDSGTAIPVATLKVNGLPYFAGVIIARHDRHISSLKDLKGKDVLAYQKSSAGAYIFPLYHLIRNGIDPFKELKSLRQSYNQDNIVLAVHAGRIDAGFVRSGILESLAAEGRINADELVVVDERQDELKHRHTTELYPERFLLVSTKLDKNMRYRLQQAALALPVNDPASRAAGIDGFVPPLSLEKVREAMHMLSAPAFGSAHR